MADQLCSTAGSLTSDREKHYEVRDIDTLSNGLSRPPQKTLIRLSECAGTALFALSCDGLHPQWGYFVSSEGRYWAKRDPTVY